MYYFFLKILFPSYKTGFVDFGLKAESTCVTLDSWQKMGARKMNAKFFELKKEKQDRMINAALKVFAINGYKHASTDDVVKEAGISKGLLFHYFDNKLGAYQFAYDYSVRYMSLELSTFVPVKERDFFEIIKMTQSARLDAMKGYPYMQQFLARSTYEDENEIRQYVSQKKGILEDAYQDVYRRINFNALPQGTDGRLLYQMINHAVDGLILQHFQEGSFQADVVLGEVMQYISVMKKLVTAR